MYDLIIIGGGPAAMSAAIYAARKQIKILLLTKELGGQIIESAYVENYLGYAGVPGVELVQKFAEHLKKFSANSGFQLEIKEGEAVEKVERQDNGFLVRTKKGEYESRALIAASGKRERPLDAIGAQNFEGKGIVYCATCDAPLFGDKIVAVVGAGDAGQDTAWQLTQYAKKIYVINKYPDLRGDNIDLRNKLKSSDKIEIIGNAWVKEVRGEKFVKEIVLEISESQEEKVLPIDGVFVEIGSMPSNNFLNGLVDLNEKGEIIVDHNTCATSAKGIFAAGDVTNVAEKQLIVAAGEGAKAALSAYKFLQKAESK